MRSTCPPEAQASTSKDGVKTGEQHKTGGLYRSLGLRLCSEGKTGELPGRNPSGEEKEEGERCPELLSCTCIFLQHQENVGVLLHEQESTAKRKAGQGGKQAGSVSSLHTNARHSKSTFVSPRELAKESNLTQSYLYSTAL